MQCILLSTRSKPGSVQHVAGPRRIRTSHQTLRRVPLLILAFFVFECMHAEGGAPREVTLLLQGFGPEISEAGAEQAWGRLTVDSMDDLRWSGWVGHMIAAHEWRFGGILRSQSETVRWRDLDTTGTVAGPAEFFLLASSLPAQQSGVESRAREIATAVRLLHEKTGARVRLICYSGSGISARLWLQGALPTLPYTPGQVSEVITVATPHRGIGGVVRPVGRLVERYRPLVPGSNTLRRLNEELDLPTDVRFKAIVLQSDRLENRDDVPVAQYADRLTAAQLESLPAILRQGHDGAIDTLATQLHLTRAAARYENATNQPVDLVVCLLNEPQMTSFRKWTLHTQCMHDAGFMRFLGEEVTSHHTRVESRLRWLRLIAEFEVRTNFRIVQPKCRPVSCALTVTRYVNRDHNSAFLDWAVHGDAIRSGLFQRDTSVEFRKVGNHYVEFDRFNRPVRLLPTR